MNITDFNLLEFNKDYKVIKHSNNGKFKIGDILNKHDKDFVYFYSSKLLEKMYYSEEDFLNEGYIDLHQVIKSLEGLEVEIYNTLPRKRNRL